MDGFAALVSGAQDSAYLRANVAALSDVAAAETEVEHELVHELGYVLDAEVFVHRWGRGEGVAGEGRDDEMIGQGCRRELPLYDGQNGKEFKEAAWPAMEQDHGNGIWFLGEEGDEVDTVILAVRVRDGDGEVGEGVDFVFSLLPARE